MMTALNLHAIAQMSAERMLNCLVEGIAIALFAWVLLRLAGRRNSGTRFAVWFCALLAITASPLVEISHVGTAGLVPPASAAITMPRSWALYLFGAWAMIAAVGLVRVATGLWHLRTVRRECAALDPQTLDPMLRHTLGQFSAGRKVEIATSDELRVPTAIGFLKPAVVLPSWAMRELSAAELNTVLLHELAHLRRWDDWTNLAQKVLRALFFFHPAVWWVESRLALEREMACDDIVLAETANPRAYAECLVFLAEKNLLRRGVALAQAAVGRMRQTSLRILRILDARRPSAVRVWQPAPWVVGAFSVACLVSSARAPKLVAFGEANAPSAQQSASIGTMQREIPLAAPAHVVSTSFLERSSGSIATRSATRPKARTAVPRATQLLHRQQAPSAPKLVRASAPVSPETAVPQQAVFVFMHREQYGDSGPVLWHIAIWRFTVLPQGAPQATPEISSKSI
jgi:beta-lactamase regulating signal transducer with metallopeptidase domain